MIRPKTLLGSLALALGVACAPAGGGMTEADRMAAEDEVRASFEDITTAMAAADGPGVLAYIDEGAIFAFHGEVWDKAGLGMVLDAFYSGMNGVEMGEFSPLRFEVLSPDAVVVTSQNLQTVDFKDPEFSAPPVKSARTFVWVRTADGWKISHGHISQHVESGD